MECHSLFQVFTHLHIIQQNLIKSLEKYVLLKSYISLLRAFLHFDHKSTPYRMSMHMFMISNQLHLMLFNIQWEHIVKFA